MDVFSMMLWSLPLLFLMLLVGFAFADGDLTLLSKGSIKQTEIEDKVVWITGASQGIGEALARELSRLGAKLILSSRREAELLRVKASLSGKNAPDGVMILPLDLTTDVTEIEKAVEEAESFFNGAGVDIMIHNAAYERPKTPALEVSQESLKATFDVNVIGTITLTQYLAPLMLKRGKGHFVVITSCKKDEIKHTYHHAMEFKFFVSSNYFYNIIASLQMSSAAGKTPAPGQAIYSASKHAINGYFDSLRSELGKTGIKVTIICPGPIKSSSTAESSKKMLLPRCVELTLIAITHGLKEVWISDQPVLAVMYAMQYVPSLGHFIMEKIGPRRLETVKRGGNAYGLDLLFGQNKKRS